VDLCINKWSCRVFTEGLVEITENIAEDSRFIGQSFNRVLQQTSTAGKMLPVSSQFTKVNKCQQWLRLNVQMTVKTVT